MADSQQLYSGQVEAGSLFVMSTMMVTVPDSIMSNANNLCIQGGSSSSILDALTRNAPLVGTAWMVSSAILTTYSTTKFLKYTDSNQLEEKVIQKKVKMHNLPYTDNQMLSDHDRWLRRRKNKLLQAPLNKIARPALHAILSLQLRLASMLSSLSRPSLLTLYRFAGSFLLGLIIHPNFHVFQRLQATVAAAPQFAVPALFLFLANWTNSISLDRIGISLTYTSKCAIPLITVLLTLLGEGPSALPSALALVSLLPIAFGIAAASWSAPTFSVFGFLAAMTSATAQSALNVTSKRAMVRTGINGPAAQRVMVGIGLLLTIATNSLQHVVQKQTIWTSNCNNHRDGNNSRSNDLRVQSPEVVATKSLSSAATPTAALLVSSQNLPPVWLSSMAIIAYHIEYVLSFVFVKMVQPITYSTCDALRRLSIILVGRRMFARPGQEPFTRINILGIALALLGALSYSITSVAAKI